MFFTHDTLNFFYTTVGNGPHLLILGGLGDHARNWKLVADRLAPHFTVTLFDQRGAGQSSKPQGPYTIDEMAEDVHLFLTATKLAPTHVLGFSMGGKVAMQLAVSHPEVINKLILVATTPQWCGVNEPESAAKHVLTQRSATPEHFAREYDVLFSKHHRSKHPAQGFVRYKQADPYPQSDAAYFAQLAALQSFDISGELEKITRPTLIMAGNDDPLSPTANAHQLHKALKGSALKIYAEVGHVIPAERPDVFVQDVVGFLAPSAP